MTDRDRRIIQLLLKFARPKMLKRFRPDSCIAATKIAIDVLAHFQIFAFPQPVRLYAANWRLTRRINDGTWQPGDPFKPGEWSVGIGYGMPPGYYHKPFDGHMVAVIEDPPHDWVIDLSLDQASRPKKG